MKSGEPNEKDLYQQLTIPVANATVTEDVIPAIYRIGEESSEARFFFVFDNIYIIVTLHSVKHARKRVLSPFSARLVCFSTK